MRRGGRALAQPLEEGLHEVRSLLGPDGHVRRLQDQVGAQGERQGLAGGMGSNATRRIAFRTASGLLARSRPSTRIALVLSLSQIATNSRKRLDFPIPPGP